MVTAVTHTAIQRARSPATTSPTRTPDTSAHMNPAKPVESPSSAIANPTGGATIMNQRGARCPSESVWERIRQRCRPTATRYRTVSGHRARRSAPVSSA